MKDIELEPHEYWYYFGKCKPVPTQIKEGHLPHRPYKRFKTEQECQDYIDGLNTIQK